MYNFKKCLLPTIFDSMFTFQRAMRSCNTRQEHSFHLPFCRTQKKKNSICYTGPRLWNYTILPLYNNFVSCRTVSAFKKSFKMFLLDGIVSLRT